MTNIVIVRHGNTFDPGDAVLRVGARTDLPLSQSGQDQAAQLAEEFERQFPAGFHLAYCSPLQRTKQTAKRILQRFNSRPMLQTKTFLTEIDYGPDEGQPESIVTARLGKEAIALWDSSAVPPPGWDVDPDRLRRDWKRFFSEMSKQSKQRRVLVVTSNGTARFALDAVTENREQAADIKLKTGAYGVLNVEGERIELISWNRRPNSN